MKLVHWPLMDGLLHLVQRGGAWAGPQQSWTWIGFIHGLDWIGLGPTEKNRHNRVAS